MSLRAARLLLQRAAPVGANAWRRGAPALALRSAQSLRAFSDRGAPPPSDNAPARGAPPPKELEPHDWHPVVDPETQGTYYHNPMTGLVTAVGVEKPAWEPVEAQGGIYWWNIDTDETTAVGGRTWSNHAIARSTPVLKTVSAKSVCDEFSPSTPPPLFLITTSDR